ncbi:MAG: Appr-1-p processing protein [Verrucomicrobia bacterium]|nr:Appr-1-p processing protein [Verrucomicrobiota bacterium]
MKLTITHGDLLDQQVEVIVNAWNRNLIPWWLLLPKGISGAIKRHGGTQPFRELRKHGVLPLGGAVMTGAGRLGFKGIIHVAGIGHDWMPSEKSIRESVRNALKLAKDRDIHSIAFPLVGAGTGGMDPAKVMDWMTEEARISDFDGEVVIVVYAKGPTA